MDIDDCDLTNREQTIEVIEAYHPDVVIHCAAYTAVDKAESDRDTCRRINVEGTENVAIACTRCYAKIIYISTDYVYSGEGSRPFEVDDPIAPQSVYGATKYEGEQMVRKHMDKYFIVRTSWIFGLNGNNFVKTMLRLGREKEQITVVDDQIGSPTYTVDLAVALCQMAQTDRYGVYHVTNEDFCSWYEFAQEIMLEAGLTCKVLPISTEAYHSAAKRPLNSRLSKSAFYSANFQPLPSWKSALSRYLDELKH